MVAVLQEKVPLSDHTKLFIATLIRNECRIKYQAFGRELNAHFRKDFHLENFLFCTMKMTSFLMKQKSFLKKVIFLIGIGWKII